MNYGTFDVPPLKRENLKEITQFWLKLVRGLKTKLLVIAGLNALVTSSLTHFEAKSFYRCQQILYDQEEEFRRKLNKH